MTTFNIFCFVLCIAGVLYIGFCMYKDYEEGAELMSLELENAHLKDLTKDFKLQVELLQAQLGEIQLQVAVVENALEKIRTIIQEVPRKEGES